MTYVANVLITALLFVLLILLLSVKPSVSKKITVASLALAGISGFFIYGYSYAVIYDNLVLASLQALLSVCRSFVGSNDFSAISSVPIMQTMGMQVFFAFVRICALYATASAIITTIGREALKKLRLLILRREALNIIYGINDDSLTFGRELRKNKKGLVIYVSEKAVSNEDISAMGAHLKCDTHAVRADAKFLRGIGFKNRRRKLTLYALSKDSNANIRYARALLDTLKNLGAEQSSLSLVVLGREEIAVSELQSTADKYGYGYAFAVNEPQMAARLLTLKYPPCNYIAFDENGRAAENLDALIIGFGRVGQEVLRYLIMNGQFEGSNFSVSVFDKSITSTDGRFFDQLWNVNNTYDITFENSDARSRRMYEYIKEHCKTLKYVVVCTGDEKLNHEIAEDMIDCFGNLGCRAPVIKCSRKGVEAYAADGTAKSSYNVYREELIGSDSLDKRAMIINKQYHQQSDKNEVQLWMECDYFSRQSCRASADFLPAMIRAAGKTEEQVKAEGFVLTDSQKENLSKTEHLRWCAFHYCMGFSKMTDEEFSSRAEQYKKEISEHGTSNIRITKNMKAKTHACLTDWDSLEILSQKEAEVTGVYRDYQRMDTDNVMAVPSLLLSK